MIKTEGVVLGEVRFKDTSKILTLYTRKMGKISVMAQGAYRPKSQLIATTQPFSFCEFQLQKGRNFYYISQADLIESFYSIRDNMERIIYGFYILELLEKSTPDEEENEKIFMLLVKGLNILSKIESEYLKFIIAYELKFISFLGYRPYINRCVVCNNELNSNLRFSKSLGGIICNNCTSEDYTSKSVDSSFVIGLNDLLFAPLESLDKINISEKTLVRLHEILVDYILFSIDRNEFKSLDLLRTIMDK